MVLQDASTCAPDVEIPPPQRALVPHQRQAPPDALLFNAKRLGYVPAFPTDCLDTIDIMTLVVRECRLFDVTSYPHPASPCGRGRVGLDLITVIVKKRQ